MVVFAAMEFNPSPFITRIKEHLAAWRPMTAEVSHDYRDMATEFRTVLSRFPRLVVLFGWSGLFLLSVAMGIGLKLAAEPYLTIGHEDYRLIPSERLYALNVLREKALDAGARLPVESRPTYPACEAFGEEAQ